jgi:predicted ester cyclase
MSDQDVKATARRFFHSQDARRGGPAQELCADDYRAYLAGFPAMDLDGHTAFSAGFYEAFPDLRHRLEEVFADGEVATVRFRLTGTNSGAFLGTPPTGRTVDVGALALLRINSDKVAELRAEFDQLGLMQQIGVLATTARTAR